MDLVPDSVGRDKSGTNGFAFRNGATPNPDQEARDREARDRAANSHRAKDSATVEEMAARATADPAIAAHPLVQGLLVELPARGGRVPDGWLDAWLEAARAVLELLYAQRPDHTRSPDRAR
jgi:hypothetical protein